MKIIYLFILVTILLVNSCVSFKILAVFPFNGRSHHILFSSLVEELATRGHDVTVVNYFPVKKMPNLRQISLKKYDNDTGNTIDMDDYLRNLPAVFIDAYGAYVMAQMFKDTANDNCNKLVTNEELRDIITSGIKYDLVIVEQFITDCALALAYKLNAPTVGMTAHILMPWTYSRLGAPNNPAFVPNTFFSSGTKPHLYKKIQSALINFSFNMYYRYVIQRNDQEIMNRVYPEVPDLESLGRNMSLILLNQYYPLTGSRIYGANVVEIGGMHIKESITLRDQDIKKFLDDAEAGVIYISFGTVASNFSPHILNIIIKLIENTKMKFIWKADNITDWVVPKNVLIKQWIPQQATLCHPKVLAFITHSGMLSSSEAMHCGVPVVSVPLFGDQFSNSASAVECGLGVMVDIVTLNENVLEEALRKILKDRYQHRAKQLSVLWRDRPMTPMDTAVFWIEYVARHKKSIKLRPPTVNMSIYQYLMLDIYIVLAFVIVIFIYTMKISVFIASNLFFKRLKRAKRD